MAKSLKLVFFHAKWCVPCGKMKKEVFPDKRVVDFLKQKNIEVVSVDVDEHPKVASDYHVKSIPTTCLVETDGTESRYLGRIVGQIDVPHFIRELTEALEGKNHESSRTDYPKGPLHLFARFRQQTIRCGGQPFPWGFGVESL